MNYLFSKIGNEFEEEKGTGDKIHNPEGLIEILQQEHDKNIESCNRKKEEIVQSMLSDKALLKRLLIARDFIEKDVIELFWEQVEFRHKWNPTEIEPTTIPNALPSGAWRLCGYDKEHHIVSNYKLEFWNPDAYCKRLAVTDNINNAENAFDYAMDEYTRYVCYMIELMIASMIEPLTQQFVVIFDLKGFTLHMITKTNIRCMVVKLIEIAQAQYPERLKSVFLVNAPYGFETAWQLVKVLLDERTTTKVQFVNTINSTENFLLKIIDKKVLSVAYGGLHDEYPIPTKSINEEKYNSKINSVN